MPSPSPSAIHSGHSTTSGFRGRRRVRQATTVGTHARRHASGALTARRRTSGSGWRWMVTPSRSRRPAATPGATESTWTSAPLAARAREIVCTYVPIPPQPVSGGTSCETSRTLIEPRRRSRCDRLLAIPGERAAQAVLKPDRGLPAGQLTQLGVVDPLPVDLPIGRARTSDVRPDPGAREPADHLHDIE